MVTREKPRNRMDNIANIGKMEIYSKGCNCWDWLFLYLLLMIFPSIFSHFFRTSFVKMSFGDLPFWPPLVVGVLRFWNKSEKDSMATVNIRISAIHVMSWSLQFSMFSIDISSRHKCLHNVYTRKKVKTECMNWKHPDEWWSSFQHLPT